MRFFQRLTISRKLTAIIMLTSGLALLLAGIAVVLSDTVLYRNSIRRDLRALATIVADNTTAALAFENPDDARETLASLSVRTHLVQSCIYTVDSRVFARYIRQDSSSECPSTIEVDSERIAGGHLHLFRPILLSGSRVGTLYFQYDLGELAERRALYSALVGGIIAVCTLISLMLSSRLRLLVSQPIVRLADSAKAVSESKDYGIRAERQTGDEVGMLVDTFNEMLANIQQRDAELRKARDELEARVAERTEELRQELVMRKSAEASLQRYTDELARSNAELEQFAYVASHDLQEPLRMVTTFMRKLANEYHGKLDAEADEYIGYAVSGASRMRQLISDLLALSQVSA
ncbi:MAG: HAMP domain-containing protein, partial [Acidobacteria bacterium]|nr:HAMP domain-containing protein [Acidobacteriota bacterium]